MCIQQTDELREIEIKDIYMDNKSFKMLKEENKEELRRHNHWDTIVDGCECLKLSGHL